MLATEEFGNLPKAVLLTPEDIASILPRLSPFKKWAEEIESSALKAAIEHLFNVKVLAVNVANIKGKSKAFRQRAGRRSDKRKAYVRLAEGQTLDVTAKA
jgi:hypothetical protein